MAIWPEHDPLEDTMFQDRQTIIPGEPAYVRDTDLDEEPLPTSRSQRIVNRPMTKAEVIGDALALLRATTERNRRQGVITQAERDLRKRIAWRALGVG